MQEKGSKMDGDGERSVKVKGRGRCYNDTHVFSIISDACRKSYSEMNTCAAQCEDPCRYCSLILITCTVLLQKRKLVTIKHSERTYLYI